VSPEFVSDDSLINSMIAILPKRKFDKILDPCCGSGELISKASKYVLSKEAIGVDIDESIIQYASSVHPEIDFICEDSSNDLEFPKDFDLVIGELPVGFRCEERIIDGSIVTKNASDAVLFHSLLKLKPGGIGVFMALQGLLFGLNSKKITKALSSNGINPIGLFHIKNPLGERSSIPGIILVFQRKEDIETVVGKAPNGSEKFLPELRSMIYQAGEGVEGYRKSVFWNISSFTSEGEPVFEGKSGNVESLRSKLNNIGADIYGFEEVVSSHSNTKSPDYERLPHKENSIYLPKARGIVKVSQDELSVKLKNYYQLVLDPLIANSIYVMDTLNSDIGKAIFDICASGTVIPQISKSGLKKMLFPLPPIEEQNEWADISLEITQREAELIRLNAMLHERRNIAEIKEILKGDKTLKPIEHLIQQDEDLHLERKSSLWSKYNNSTGNLIENQEKKSHELQDAVVKTIAAFLNTDGGVLLIGLSDRKGKKAGVVGIKPDYRFCKKGYQNKEGFQHALIQILKEALMKKEHLLQTKIKIEILYCQNEEICRIDVKPQERGNIDNAVFVKTKTLGDEEFFTRIGDTTSHNSNQTALKYIVEHFQEKVE
jgi:hypothetical protein